MCRASSGSRSSSKCHRPLDVGKQRRDGLALAVRGAARCQGLLLGEDAFGQMAGRVADRAQRCRIQHDRPGPSPCSLRGCRVLLAGGCAGGANPDEDAPILIHGELLGINQIFFEILERVIIELQLALQDAIREALLLLE